MEEVLERLAAARRNGEIIQSMVRTSGKKKMPVHDEQAGKLVTKEVECAVFELEGGVKGLCPAHEFSEHKFNSLVGFVGTVQDIVITEFLPEEKFAVVSVRLANEIKKLQFWKKLEQLEQAGTLQDEIFEGVITGYNKDSKTVFLKIEGEDCFLKRPDWDYVRRNLEDEAVRNTKIQVKVLRFDKENKLVQVSRKAAMPDPLELLKEFKEDEAVVGRVTAVHPVHGIFVQVMPGLQIKASKPKYLESPVIDDIVTLRIREIDEEKRQARSVIIGYPQGKKQIKDVGSFLYG